MAIALGRDGTFKYQDVFIVAADGTSLRLPKGVRAATSVRATHSSVAIGEWKLRTGEASR